MLLCSSLHYVSGLIKTEDTYSSSVIRRFVNPDVLVTIDCSILGVFQLHLLMHLVRHVHHINVRQLPSSELLDIVVIIHLLIEVYDRQVNLGVCDHLMQ